jgi:hypothetical protein
VAEHYLLVTDPPHRDADQETAAKCLGWSVAEVRARLPHPAPEIWHAELDADGARDKAKLLIGAGFKMALVRGKVLAAVPAADPVSAISLSDGGFSLATSSGTLEVPREAHVVAVVAHPKEVLPETLHPGEDEVPAALFVDVYVQAGKRWRAGRLEATHVEFSGLGVLKQATAAANVRIITDELEARFSDAQVDQRLMHVNYRHANVSGRTMPELLTAISPKLQECGRFDLASRLVFLTALTAK